MLNVVLTLLMKNKLQNITIYDVTIGKVSIKKQGGQKSYANWKYCSRLNCNLDVLELSLAYFLKL